MVSNKCKTFFPISRLYIPTVSTFYVYLWNESRVASRNSNKQKIRTWQDEKETVEKYIRLTSSYCQMGLLHYQCNRGCGIFRLIVGYYKISLFQQIEVGILKFTFSEKATKIDQIFTVNLLVCSNRQIDGEDFINFCGLLRKHEL